MVPGRKFWISTSARATSRWKARRAPSFFRSTAMPRLFRYIPGREALLSASLVLSVDRRRPDADRGVALVRAADRTRRDRVLARIRAADRAAEGRRDATAVRSRWRRGLDGDLPLGLHQ